MRNSPEEWGAYVGEERRTENHFSESRKRNMGRFTIHHMMWIRKNHLDWLRDVPEFKPPTYEPAHIALHANCPSVPSIEKQTLRVIRAEFEPTGDTLESLDDLLCILRGLETSYKIDPVDRMILPLVEHALEIQIPYLRGNIKQYKNKADLNYDNYVRGYK